LQDFDDEELKEIHMGRLIQVLSHQMKRKNYVISMINDDGKIIKDGEIPVFA
jgi:hypothetical protein